MSNCITIDISRGYRDLDKKFTIREQLIKLFSVVKSTATIVEIDTGGIAPVLFKFNTRTFYIEIPTIRNKYGNIVREFTPNFEYWMIDKVIIDPGNKLFIVNDIMAVKLLV